MTKLRTLRQCTWDEIEVGEVFAEMSDHYCLIMLKLSEEDVLILADDVRIFPFIPEDLSGDKYLRFPYLINHLYKLPKFVQRLWKEGE